VIYVDNASQDDSVEMVRKEFPEVQIIQNAKNEGFIRANNQAIVIARGRYVLLLNSDTVVLGNAVAKTVKFADEHPKAAVVGCRILNPDGTLQRNCFMSHSALNLFLSATYLYKVFPRSRFFAREEMTWWNFDDAREVEVVNGCFALVREEAIKQVGLMDETYFVYGDDQDWCYRFRKAGWKAMFTPDPQIVHYRGQTTKQKVGDFKLQLYGSQLIFMKLHGNGLAFLLARLLTALFLFLRVPYWLGAGLYQKKRRKTSLQTAKAYSLGTLYCLTDWKRLLMNKEAVAERL